MPAAIDIVVPVYNEEACVPELIARVEALGLRDALLFVDNASTDGTVTCIERAGARLIRHATNAGYGASIRDGLAATTAARVVIIDADLEYPPEAIPALVAALDRHPVVYGSRFLGPEPADMSRRRRLGNRLISALFNRLFRQATTDLYTGMKALRRDALDALRLRRDGFDSVVEMGAQLAAAGFAIHDVAVRYAPRARGASKMRHAREVARSLWCIVTFWLGARSGPRPTAPAPSPRRPT